MSYTLAVTQYADVGCLPLGVPVTSVTSPVAVGGSPVTRLYPDEPDSAADVLDAADGIFDGKYFGMKILASTKADRYLSPTKGFPEASYSSDIVPSVTNVTTSYTSPSFGPAPTPSVGFAPTLPAGGVLGGAFPPSSSVDVSGSFTNTLPPPSSGVFASSLLSPGATLPASSSFLSSPAPFSFTTPTSTIINDFYGNLSSGSLFPPPTAVYGSSQLPPATFTMDPSASMTNAVLPAFPPYLEGASLTQLPLSSSFPTSYMGTPYPVPLASSVLSATLPPASPVPAVHSSSLTPPPGALFVGSSSVSSPTLPSLAVNAVAELATPVKSMEGGGGSTINISNTGWEKAVDDLKKDVDSLKAEGGMAALRDLLQMKVEELERVRQSELVKEKELHRLQDMYAEEIRKHTEDLARARKAEADLAALRQAEADRLRALQVEQERAAAEALAKLEALRAAEAAKPKKKAGKKKAKKAAKGVPSPKRSPIKIIR